MTSEFEFFSSNPSLNHIKLEKCLLLFATNTNICTLLFKEIKTDGKSFIFAVCRLTYDHVTSNLISLIKTNERIRIFHNYWSPTLSTILTIQFLVVFLIFVQWPTTVTAKELTSRQKKKPHGKRKNLTVKIKKTHFKISSMLRGHFLFVFLLPWGY